MKAIKSRTNKRLPKPGNVNNKLIKKNRKKALQEKMCKLKYTLCLQPLNTFLLLYANLSNNKIVK